MSWLNCADRESTLQSLSEALDVSPHELMTAIKSVGPATGQGLPPHREIATAVAESIGVAIDVLTTGLEGVIHYHASRSIDPDLYIKSGILPLGRVIDEIWNTLRLISPSISNADWISIRHLIESGAVDSHSAWLYMEKVAQSRVYGGPFGRLIREVHIAPPPGERDFLRNAPEIVEDIDNVLVQLQWASCYERYIAATRPCIVAFRSRLVSPDLVEAAILYLHGSDAGTAVGVPVAGAGFTGKGQAVPASEVVEVEVIDL